MKSIVVSNRLPLKITKNGTEFVIEKIRTNVNFDTSDLPGKQNHIWIGNIGDISATEDEKKSISKRLVNEYNCHPLFLEKDLNTKYEFFFCNKTLHPLLHSFNQNVNFYSKNSFAYYKVNKIFAEAVLRLVTENTTVYIQDYHLFYVPEILKRRSPNLKVVFSLYTPFPAADNFANTAASYTRRIIRSLSKCDLIELPRPEHSVNLISLFYFYRCKKIPEIKSVFSVKTNFRLLQNSIENEKTQKMAKLIEKYFKDKKIVIQIEQADYTSGILQKYKAIDMFLEKNPDLAEKVVFLQIILPSLFDVQDLQYQSVYQVNNVIKDINRRYSDQSHMPIKIIFDSLTLDELYALFLVGDVIFASSLKNENDQTALEYVICKQNACAGVVIMSEHIGAVDILPGAIAFQPLNINQGASAILKALTMSQEEREKRQKMNLKSIKNNSNYLWPFGT